MGRLLIAVGLLFILAGLTILALGRLGAPLGRYPGDLSFRGKSYQIFAPLGTSLLLSVLLSLLLYIVSRFRR